MRRIVEALTLLVLAALIMSRRHGALTVGGVGLGMHESQVRNRDLKLTYADHRVTSVFGASLEEDGRWVPSPVAVLERLGDPNRIVRTVDDRAHRVRIDEAWCYPARQLTVLQHFEQSQGNVTHARSAYYQLGPFDERNFKANSVRVESPAQPRCY